MEAIVKRFWRGSDLRRSRLHDEKGRMAIGGVRDVLDMAYAFGTAAARKVTGYHAPFPWLALNAFRFLREHLSENASLFEWGCGMSTLWYERHCREVHSVEHDPVWYRKIADKVHRANVYHLSGESYVTKIHDFPGGYFDVIVIDGIFRHVCFQAAHQHLKSGGLLVIDNTDKDQTTQGDLWRIGAQLDGDFRFFVQRFTGWAPGNAFPQETTVAVRT